MTNHKKKESCEINKIRYEKTNVPKILQSTLRIETRRYPFHPKKNKQTKGGGGRKKF